MTRDMNAAMMVTHFCTVHILSWHPTRLLSSTTAHAPVIDERRFCSNFNGRKEKRKYQTQAYISRGRIYVHLAARCSVGSSMEQKEAHKFGHDREGLSKRRLSSILKAPRTSMKVIGNDQDENQEETRPIEKQRRSRRVSFATTNNIHVFPKDIKADPVLAPIQNLTVGANDGQNEKMHCFDTSENHEIMGLDTMLTTPIHFALNKENFFPEPILPVDSVDRTVLLGENTGYMDMTHSQTIAIDMEDEFNPELTLNMSNLSEPHKLNSQNSMPCKTFGTMEKDVMHLEFNDFLASLSKRSAQNVSASFPKKNNDHFTFENTSNAKIDKENVQPTCLTKHALLERDHMDMTNSHTVVIEEREAFQHFPYSVGGNRRSTNTGSSSNYLDDMELTHSQTATINFKGMEDVHRSMPYEDRKKCKFVCDDTSEMIMTQVLDEYVQDQEQLSEQNRADHFQRNVSFAPMADSDDMEVTQSQTVVLETKYGGEPFSKSSKVSSFASSMTGNADRMMMNTTQIGNVTPGALAASETGACKRNMTLATSTVFHNDQSDFMELTCQASTGVLSPDLDDSVLKGCSNVAIDSKHISTTNVMLSKPQASFMLPPSVSSEVKRADHFKSELSLSHMVDDMEMTECHTVGDDLENTHHTVCDDMEMTQCQTVVLETKSCDEYKSSDKSKKRLSLVSTSVGTKAMTHEHTGHMELNRYSFSKRTKAENCMVPTAQRFLLQDLPDCMEIQQGTASDMHVIHDEMELTGCKTITIDTKTSWVTSPSNKVQSTPGVLSSRPKIDKMKRSEAILEKLGTVPASQAVDCKSPISVMDLDAGNLVAKHKEAISDVAGMDLVRDQTVDTKTDHKNYKPSSSNVNVNENVSLNSTVKNVESSEEDCNMEITRAFTVPLEEQCCVAFNQEEMARETVETTPITTDQKIFKEMDHTLPINNETVSSAKKEGYVFESDVDTLRKEHSSSVKSRRRSLADLQVKLQNISQYIGEQDGLLAGSVTAPLVSFTVVSPVDKHSEIDSSLQPSKETQLLENKINLSHKEGTTPFNLKNSLMARLSVGGIMPKFPPRARSASPNQTEPKSPNDLQGFQLQTCFNADVQNGSYETDLIDEVLPEEDFSGTLVSYLSKNKEPDVTTGVDLNDDANEYDRMESVMNINQSEKLPPEVKDATVKDTSEKLWDSNYAPTHVVKIDDTNSSSNSTTMKCEGISELTLRNSQLDSQIEGTMDLEFDFYKKLEEGSVTVNEFLTHFGAKFVIHRSRPSALPDNFRAEQTYTMEDLLKEKYIHRPKQKLYETDCQNLCQMVEGFKTEMADQDKPLRSINGTLLQDICAFSKEQLQRFGAKLKERRVYFRKRRKVLSHKMKENLYSELLKMTQETKQSLMTKIKETNEMLKDLDGCINDLESELIGMNNIVMGDQHSLIRLEPVLKAKQEELDALNSEVTEKEKQICKLELQAQTLADTWDKVQDETRELECRTTNLNSLNEWRFKSEDKNGVVFTFLHDTVQLEVKHKKTTGKECMQDDVERDVDISFKFLLNAESSQPSAIMIHKLLTENINSQAKWMQKYSTTQNIPMLLHDVSVVVSRLRLLGEEIHRLKKWGGLRLGILHITCVDTLVEVMFSSVRAFVKFELSLAVTPDYPFRPLQLQKFKNHIGDTRLEQIKDIISSVRPAKNYLTTVMKRIHSNLLG
ncbi:hypothetical protein PGIGA_G00158920 [Pangasianodon gigas]|uniref:Uncharacterized protein n=1 Tax=Pangasianodon gigas TaxID=30993 RepID=A0ACC5XQQ7_PANGG|nr:hypothetical protein [Pangasianodon gigas]